MDQVLFSLIETFLNISTTQVQTQAEDSLDSATSDYTAKQETQFQSVDALEVAPSLVYTNQATNLKDAQAEDHMWTICVIAGRREGMGRRNGCRRSGQGSSRCGKEFL